MTEALKRVAVAEPGTVCLQCGWPASTLRPGEVCSPIIPQESCPSCGVRLLPLEEAPDAA